MIPSRLQFYGVRQPACGKQAALPLCLLRQKLIIHERAVFFAISSSCNRFLGKFGHSQDMAFCAGSVFLRIITVALRANHDGGKFTPV